MEFDRPLTCEDCIHHELPSCKRVEYGIGYNPLKIRFNKNTFAPHPVGRICSDFELCDFYYNSPSYKNFTLDRYIVYRGIEKLETKMTSISKLTTVQDKDDKFVFDKYRYSFDGSHSLHYGRDKDYKFYYRIYKGDKILKSYKDYGIYNYNHMIFDWVDILRLLYHRIRDKEYEKQVKDMFLSGYVIFLTIDDKIAYKVEYKDFFYHKDFKPVKKYEFRGRDKWLCPKWVEVECGKEW